MEYPLYTVGIGTVATVLMDLWSVIRKRLFAVALPDYALVGRWLVGIGRGRVRHASIATSPPVAHERLVGWLSHYLIGVLFAALLVSVFGATWLDEPTLAPALIVGIGTVAAPFLVMQPGMGAGIAASRSRAPWSARFHSLITHAVFGLGLYVGGRVISVGASL